jgi:hypothetical protein
MRFSGLGLFASGLTLKSLPVKVYPKASPAEIKANANAEAAAKASIAMASRGTGFGQSYLPSVSKLAPEERQFIMAIAKSVQSDPARAAKIKFSDADGKKVASLDQYISDLQTAIDSGFSGAA